VKIYSVIFTKVANRQTDAGHYTTSLAEVTRALEERRSGLRPQMISQM